jgi:hypothetical protein
LTAKTRNTLTSLLLGVIAAGCSSNVTLPPPTIPVPLMDKIPISVAVRMPQNFYSFIHEEETYGRDEWSINLGNSNAAFFTQLFGFMFNEVTVLKANEDPASIDIDALIEPSIDAFEFSTPSQSRADAFAVWVRYRIKVFDRDGNQVANWPVSAYGKSSTEGINDSESLQRAAVLAMRDAAALMIMKLDAETGIGALSAREPPAAIPAAAPGTAGEDGDSGLQTTAMEDELDDAS